MMRDRYGLLWVVNLFALTLFAVMWWSVTHDAWLLTIDDQVCSMMPSLRMEGMDGLVKMLTDMNGFVGATLFFTAVVILFWYKRWYRAIGFYTVSTLGATGLFVIVKFMLARSRPEGAIIEMGGYSFPSGHTTMATAMAFGLYVVLKERSGRTAMAVVLFVAALGWALLIASTRLYLGVHWFTDVVGGFGLGLWWVTLVRMVWGKRPLTGD